MVTLIKWIIAAVIILVSQIVNAQQVEGMWNGALNVSGSELPVVITVVKNNDSYTSTLKSPRQSDQEFPCDKTVFAEGNFQFEVSALKISFKGVLKDNEIKGTFSQGAGELPLILKRGDVRTVSRLQDPKKPYPYTSIDVSFNNASANNIKLSGTLTLPKDVDNPPVIILISGSGPQNRDEEIKAFNHRPFLVLSDYLTRNGVAVLRYDDRGVAKSEGVFEGATSADFATDVEAAIDFLKKRRDVNTQKIGLVGHSEGGFIAPMVASRRKDVSFVVLLSGTGVAGREVLLSQINRGAELENVPAEIIKINNKFVDIVLSTVYHEDNPQVIKTKVKKEIETYHRSLNNDQKEKFPLGEVEKQLRQFVNDPWMHYFIKTDPAKFLSKTKVPVLALNGSKDFQVITEINLTRIDEVLKKSGNEDITIKEIEGVNHLFQMADTGASSEYAKIEETFNVEVMKMISDWINKRF
ncbi:alpha/beta fold hydrolase [Aquimarina gracilis]|uniref:Alpha/beta fold hydrolase n=1 Tax=Aquimarina gracilis TaxID=874422 RepID=A0ABU5ZRN9_9FLAO|nr:alpha/beta fold hydrolase [Aquimarina gracilis]MEB3344712.1 alpha/beta fold hydrolase [Aquimarina gracilis]